MGVEYLYFLLFNSATGVLLESQRTKPQILIRLPLPVFEVDS